jgi:hypothetical protein
MPKAEAPALKSVYALQEQRPRENGFRAAKCTISTREDMGLTMPGAVKNHVFQWMLFRGTFVQECYREGNMKLILGLLITAGLTASSQAQDVQAMAKAMRDNMPPSAKCIMSDMTGKPICEYKVSRGNDRWELKFSGGNLMEPNMVSAWIIVQPPGTEEQKQLGALFVGFLERMGFSKEIVGSCFDSSPVGAKTTGEVTVGRQIGTCLRFWDQNQRQLMLVFEMRPSNRF